MSFKNLKKNRSKSIDKLVEAATAQTSRKSYADDRFWQPTIDKSGNGYAVIRFLPAPEGEPTPWVSYWDHGFQGPTGQWYIEKSRTTLGEDDPVSQYNSKLWNSGSDEDKETVRKQKRRLHYVTNILVVSDPGNPDNEGKQFLYKFGKKIFEKINDVMVPEFEDETPINPFDFWEGADFKLKIRKVEGYRNYDKSEFADPSEVFDGDDDKLEALYNGLYSLSEINDPKNFKSYDELQSKLNRVLCLDSSTESTNAQVSLDDVANSAMDSAPSVSVDDTPSVESNDDDSSVDADDAIDYFKKLASGG